MNVIAALARILPAYSVLDTGLMVSDLIYRHPLRFVMDKEKKRTEGPFVDCEVVHDSIGVTHFLPPRRCKNCDE